MSKLHAKDLMIGDWVLVDNYPKKVTSIIVTDDGVEQIYTFGKTCQVGTISFYIQPIPLTAEILEKNGFVGDGYANLFIDDTTYLQYYYNEHRLRKYFNGIDKWDNHRELKDITFQCHCYYVHEFQHALKLCGMNKNIEL